MARKVYTFEKKKRTKRKGIHSKSKTSKSKRRPKLPKLKKPKLPKLKLK